LKLSIIIPCYNEEETIKPLLDSIFKVSFPIKYEIIVVDDGSLINHKKILKEEIDSKKIKFIRLLKNQGKGVAIRVGLKYATGEIFIIQDADFEYFPTDIPKLLEPILKKEVNVVYGTRFAERPKLMSKFHYNANKFLTYLTNLFYNCNLTDMETGYKLFTQDVLKKITLSTREFEFEPEITAKILLNNFQIKEIPIKYKYRSYGQTKINWMDGFESLLILLQQKFCPKSRFYNFIYSLYKFHIKKILIKLTKFIAKFIYLRRI